MKVWKTVKPWLFALLLVLAVIVVQTLDYGWVPR